MVYPCVIKRCFPFLPFLLLRVQFDFGDPLRFTAHRNANGEQLYRSACRKGREGLIAKRADSPYLHSRSRHWLKFKCVNRQELLIGGYTDPGAAAAASAHYYSATMRMTRCVTPARSAPASIVEHCSNWARSWPQ